MAMNKEISIDAALNGKKTFYGKFWQQNNYYPIYKFVYHADTDEFEKFNQKESGWHSWGISKAQSVSNKEWLRYTFEHSSWKLSFDEMRDNLHYNLE